MKIYFPLLFLGILAASCKEKKATKIESTTNEESLHVAVDSISKNFRIEILDEEALSLLNKDATIKVLASGFKWTEGPLWIENGNFLLFSDVMDNKVYKWSEDNNISVYLEPSGYTGEGTYSNEPGSNGLIRDGDKLILMQHGDRRVAKMKTNLDKPESSFSTLADSFEGKKFNSPNDGFLDAHGNLYFTDPPYGLPELMEDPTKELDFQGVYCLMADGELRLLDTLSRPNGIAQSPDGNTLYVAVSDPAHAVWYSYDIEEPGNISNKDLFYDATQEVNQVNPNGLPDGLKIHSKGYLFASGPKGLWIFSPTAKLLARIYTGQATSNCAFNTDESTLFITADDHLLSIKLQ